MHCPKNTSAPIIKDPYSALSYPYDQNEIFLYNSSKPTLPSIAHLYKNQLYIINYMNHPNNEYNDHVSKT